MTKVEVNLKYTLKMGERITATILDLVKTPPLLRQGKDIVKIYTHSIQ